MASTILCAQKQKIKFWNFNQLFEKDDYGSQYLHLKFWSQYCKLRVLPSAHGFGDRIMMAEMNGPAPKQSSSLGRSSHHASPAVQIHQNLGSPPVGLNVQCSSGGSNPSDNGSSLLERFFPSPTSNNRYKKVCTLDCEPCRMRIKQLIREESNLMPYECLSAPCSRKSSQACDGESERL